MVVLPIFLYVTDASPQYNIMDVGSSLLFTVNHTERTATTTSQAVSSKHRQQTFSQINTAAAVEQESFLHNKNNAKAKNNGFHAIHVYHGPDDAIDSLPHDTKGLVSRNHRYYKGSQVSQDKIVAELSLALDPESSKKTKYFVDLAANDAINLSNTFLLEQKYGWKGLCVEPNSAYWFRLAHRQCDVAAVFAGGKLDKQKVTVSLGNKEEGGIVAKGTDNENYYNKGGDEVMEQRYTISLKTLFDDFQVPKLIDYLSLDVEGAEMLVMQDFPYDSYRINFLTVERPKPELQTILKSHQYQYVAMLIFWGETLWAHESVVNQLGMDKILEIAKANSDTVDVKARRNQRQFYLETGEYKRG